MNPHYPSVARQAAHRCEYCHAPEAAFNFPFEVDHITPRSGGGADVTDNLALACRSCNAFKAGLRRVARDSTGERIALFHPRRDAWHEHFQVDPITNDIIGLTPEARATLSLLRMNSPAQLLARRQWRRLGLFP